MKVERRKGKGKEVKPKPRIQPAPKSLANVHQENPFLPQSNLGIPGAFQATRASQSNLGGF